MLKQIDNLSKELKRKMTEIDIPSHKKWLTLGICCMSILIVSMDISILNVALPSIQRDLHASISGAQWTIDAYTLVLASLFLLAGSTADRIGRRRIFQTGLVIFVLGSFLCSIAPSLSWLIAFRMLQALGGCMLNPVALSIISNTFNDSKQRARAIGVWSGVVGVSIAAGPIIGGTLVDSVGWRSVFWINIPIGITAFILTKLFISESHAEKPRHVDPVGQILIIGFLLALTYGIIEAPSKGWSSALIVSIFSLSFVSLLSFISYERRHRQPLIELKFFRSAPFSGACIVAVCAFAALGGFLFINTLYLQDIRHFSALKAGLFLLPMAGAMFLCGPLSGYIVSRRGPRISLLLGGFSLSIATIVFATSGASLANSKLFMGYLLIGIGLGFMNAAITNTAVSGMPRSQSGVASATTSTTRQIGQTLGVAIIGSVLASSLKNITDGASFTSAFHICWWIIFSFGLAVILTALITTGKWGAKTAVRFTRSITREEHQSLQPISS